MQYSAAKGIQGLQKQGNCEHGLSSRPIAQLGKKNEAGFDRGGEFTKVIVGSSNESLVKRLNFQPQY